MLKASTLQRKREKKAARRRELRKKRTAIFNDGRPDPERRYQRAKLEKHLRRIRRKLKKAKAK